MIRLFISSVLVASALTGCSNYNQRLDSAAQTVGQSQARVSLPLYPGDCRKHEYHAALSQGQDVLSALKRERAKLDNQNTRTDRCAGFYDNLKANLH